jgi:hypothetical protein
MNNNKHTKRLNFTCDLSTLEKIQRFAKDRNMTISAYLRYAALAIGGEPQILHRLDIENLTESGELG